MLHDDTTQVLHFTELSATDCDFSSSRYYEIGVDQKKLTTISKMNFTRKVIRSRISKDRQFNVQRTNNDLQDTREQI